MVASRSAHLFMALLVAIMTSSCAEPRAGSGPFRLTVLSVGGGHLAVPEVSEVVAGTVLDLAPTPEPGWVFGYWAGPGADAISSNRIAMDSDKAVRAVFVRVNHPDLNRYKLPNPVIRPGGAGSWDGGFVADPFVFVYDGKVWLFYEGANEAGLGRIGVAVSDDGRTFKKWGSGPVLDTSPLHLSYPQVFRVGDDFYMHVTPGGASMYLFRTTAAKFPGGWTLAKATVSVGLRGSWDEDQVYDGTIFHMAGKWWMLYGGRDHSGLSRIGLAYKPGADITHGAWRKWGGDGSPTPKTTQGTGWATGHLRMGGSVVVAGGMPFFFYQGSSRSDMHLYDPGNDQQVGLGSVTLPGSQGPPTWNLGTEGTAMAVTPVLSGTPGGWDSLHVHHMSVVDWRGEHLAVYDGQSSPDGWMIGTAIIPSSVLPPVQD